MTQKERWAARAERREQWAKAAETFADQLEANHCHDWAFVSQPGHLPARARQIAQTDRAMTLRRRADEHRSKAAELRRLACTDRGDAAARRQAERDATDFAPGDRVVSTFYGVVTVVRVNSKTYRIRTASGWESAEDKSYFRGRAP